MKAILRYLLLPMFVLTSLTSCEEISDILREVIKREATELVLPYSGWQDVYVACEVTCPINDWENVVFETDRCYYKPLYPANYCITDGGVVISQYLTNPSIDRTFKIDLMFNSPNGSYIEVGKIYSGKFRGRISNSNNTEQYVEYLTTTDGWLVVDSCEQYENTRHIIVSGRFEFSGYNRLQPDDIVVVKNGVFKDVILVERAKP